MVFIFFLIFLCFEKKAFLGDYTKNLPASYDLYFLIPAVMKTCASE